MQHDGHNRVSSYIRLNSLTLNKIFKKISIALATFQGLNSHMSLVATILDGAIYRPFPLSQKVLFNSTAL